MCGVWKVVAIKPDTYEHVANIGANLLTNVCPFSMTLRSTNLARILPRNSTEMSRNPFESSTENTELQDYMIGANSTTTNCFLWITHPLHLGFMVYQKYTKLTAHAPHSLSLWDSHLPFS